MKFSEVIKLLQEKNIVDKREIQGDDVFHDIALIDDNTSNCNEDYLYIGHIGQVYNMKSLPKFLLYYGENSYKSDIKLTNSVKIKEKDLPLAFNVIRKELMASLKVEQTYTKMLRMILNGRGISSILDELREKTGNAVAVLDITGKIISHSTPFDVPDSLWIDSADKGYCPYEFMEHLGKKRSKGISPKSTKAFISICEERNLEYLCSKVLSQEHLLGYVFMFRCKNNFDEKSKELLPMISRAASEVMLRGNDNKTFRSNLYSNILVDILEGINPTQARIRIQNSDLSFPKSMKVLYVRPSYYHGKNYVKRELYGKLLMIFDKTPSLYYKKGIAVIVPVDGNYSIDEMAMDSLKDLISIEHLKVGISNSFSEPAHFAKYYKQAEDALRFAKRLNNEEDISNYNDFAFFHMINELPMELHLGKFCHPVLARLREYDHEKHTELYDTLKLLAETGFNQKKTADMMYIHRNTLNYRKKRIEEIGGISLNEPGLLFQLLYSFEIDNFIENRNQ